MATELKNLRQKPGAHSPQAPAKNQNNTPGGKGKKKKGKKNAAQNTPQPNQSASAQATGKKGKQKKKNVAQNTSQPKQSAQQTPQKSAHQAANNPTSSNSRYEGPLISAICRDIHTNLGFMKSGTLYKANTNNIKMPNIRILTNDIPKKFEANQTEFLKTYVAFFENFCIIPSFDQKIDFFQFF